ncbi:MAG: Gfo/Idh/MocA family oxidoreductase [Clostridia bacterium]|nr:Gfo/Idh/MocA family oxidoreductase [Clostridia bacterium]
MKPIKIGVFGVGRGMSIAKNFQFHNCEIVALCDNRKDRMEEALKILNDPSVATYEDFDEFLNHPMDAVILANFFYDHAPYAIRCMEKGIHIYSECIANGTMAEGVELIRAAEKSKSIYFLAENYPQMLANREIKRVCDTKTLGKILYAEGEYNHPGNPADTSARKRLNYFETHWRNFLPKTYYVTHSLGPIMYFTGATPKRVAAFSSFAGGDDLPSTASYVGDRAAIIITQNDDGSVFRFTGHASFGARHDAYRVCGTEGQVENIRGTSEILLRYNPWSVPEGMEATNRYTLDYEGEDAEILKISGHAGGDWWTPKLFLDCIKEGKQPEHPYDVHSAVAMSSVAILGHRSVLCGGKPYDIPDFHTEEARKQYENDRETPFYKEDGTAPTIPCCSKTDYKPTEAQLQAYRESLQ